MPALWIVGLVLFGLGAATAAVVALIVLVRPSPVERDLRAWGVVGEAETPWLFHDHSAAGDRSSGCVAAGERVVRFDDRVVTGAVDLPDADVRYVLDDAAAVVVSQGDRVVVCPFGLGEGADTFAELLRVSAARRRPEAEAWGPGRDPRL